MTFINIIQFTVALFIDSRYEKKNIAGLIFVSWYPTIYWIINAAVVIFAFPKALKRKKGGYATSSSRQRKYPTVKSSLNIVRELIHCDILCILDLLRSRYDCIYRNANQFSSGK